MPIPALNEDGLLPVGVHDCRLEEIAARFGRFQSSDRRPRLFAALRAFLDEMRTSGLFEALLIDGSFVTAKPAPNDIDLILVLRATHSFRGDLPPLAYNFVRPAKVRKRWKFDVVVAKADSEAYFAAVDLFQQVRNEPWLKKGILRITL